jgi:hypothetical protein
MAIHRSPQAVLDKVQMQMAGEARFRPESTLANIEAATQGHDWGVLFFRRRHFWVPPVPYRQGLWLLALDQELRRLGDAPNTKQNILQAMAVVKEMLNIFHTLVRPRTRFDKLFWRWRDNPFLHAEMGEINVLRNFFCSARTTSSVRALRSIRAPSFLRRTWPTPSRSLSIGTQRGWDLTETPAAGLTTHEE